MTKACQYITHHERRQRPDVIGSFSAIVVLVFGINASKNIVFIIKSPPVSKVRRANKVLAVVCLFRAILRRVMPVLRATLALTV